MTGKSKKKKVLIVQLAGYAVDGMSTWLNNILKYMDLTKYDITFFTAQSVTALERMSELKNLGIRMISGDQKLPQPSDSLKKKLDFHIKTITSLKNICKDEAYDIIHVNTASVIFSVYVLFLARCLGIKKRIVHSHAVDLEQNWTGFRKVISWNATDLLACSDLAAKSLFGERGAQKAIVMKNGVDTERFAFSSSSRAEYRKKFGIGDKEFVIGHVGYFASVKNHHFLVEVFGKLVSRESSAKLLLIGTGSLEQEIRAQVKSLGLEEKVIFAGTTECVENYYCAMDVFAMPSLHEGLPFVGIEAQTSGLSCFFSDQISQMVKVTENAQFLPIQDSDLWAEKILSSKQITASQRENAWIAVKKAGFDLRDCAAELEKIYLSSPGK